MLRTNISTLIVDTQARLYPVINRVLTSQPAIKLVMAHDYIEAEKQASQMSPAIIWLDIHMGNGDGIAEIRRLKKLAPASRILAITGEENEQEAFAAIMAGAQGYSSRETIDLQEIESLQQLLMQDECVIRPELLLPLMQHLRSEALWQPGHAPHSRSLPFNSKPKDPAQLSSQERKIARFISQGYRDRDIARMLHHSKQTVRKLAQRILNKPGL